MIEDHKKFEHKSRFIESFPEDWNLKVKKPIPIETAECIPGDGGWLARFQGAHEVIFSGETEQEAIAELHKEIAGAFYGLSIVEGRLSKHMSSVLGSLKEYIESTQEIKQVSSL